MLSRAIFIYYTDELSTD